MKLLSLLQLVDLLSMEHFFLVSTATVEIDLQSQNNETQSNDTNTDPFNINLLFNIDKQLCVFKKHEALY